MAPPISDLAAGGSGGAQPAVCVRVLPPCCHNHSECYMLPPAGVCRYHSLGFRVMQVSCQCMHPTVTKWGIMLHGHMMHNTTLSAPGGAGVSHQHAMLQKYSHTLHAGALKQAYMGRWHHNPCAACWPHLCVWYPPGTAQGQRCAACK